MHSEQDKILMGFLRTYYKSKKEEYERNHRLFELTSPDIYERKCLEFESDLLNEMIHKFDLFKREKTDEQINKIYDFIKKGGLE